VHHQPAILDGVPKPTGDQTAHGETARCFAIIPPIIHAAKIFILLAIAALHQGIYATIPNYLDRELR
jgi:hypothetical protein